MSCTMHIESTFKHYEHHVISQTITLIKRWMCKAVSQAGCEGFKFALLIKRVANLKTLICINLINTWIL